MSFDVSIKDLVLVASIVIGFISGYRLLAYRVSEIERALKNGLMSKVSEILERVSKIEGHLDVARE